jgi:hypothetical protein
MLIRRCGWIVFVFALVAQSLPARAETAISYADLVRRMTDLQRLAVLPLPGETAAQCSSYDRASKYDAKTDKYINWDANGDGGGYIRKEGNKLVMAEMNGPGCIWRIWSARGLKGHVKIYLDGKETPAVDLPFADYFTGNVAPFNYPMLSYNILKTSLAGQDLYMPIPYQKSCKVVADEGWGVYYHFGYSSFPKGTVVPTFNAALAAENAAELQKANDFFRDHLGEDPAGQRQGQETLQRSVTLEPGQTARVAELTGPQAITGARVKRMKFANRPDQMAALRKLALRITWDGQATPAVWVPLGDFFGTAPGENLYKTLMTGMTKDGYYANWYMPFGKSATVEIINEDKSPRALDIEIVHAPLAQPMEQLGYFHAKWHRDSFPLREDRWPDWVMLRTQGRGRFCGVVLHVWNPRGGWWGEGDEKFFVDGEKFPSTFGTGSEDYFGYAWGNPSLFQRPYHAQTMTQNNSGHQGLLRWHIVDNDPFQTSFEGCIEKYDHPGRGVKYACTAFWYLSADGVDPYTLAPAAERDGYYEIGELLRNLWTVPGYPGIVSCQRIHSSPAYKLRDDVQLVWVGVPTGGKLGIRPAPVKSAGKYELWIGLTNSFDYGIVQFRLDGKKIGEPVDLYNPAVVKKELSLGVHDVAAGNHVIEVELVGHNPMARDANPGAHAGYLFGTDFIEWRPTSN